MKAQDFMDQHNNRAEMVRQLMMYCDARDYSYKYTEKEFKIQLPAVEPLPVTNQIVTKHHNEAPNWTLQEDPNGHNETDEDLPPVDTTLEEGGPK